MFYNFHVMECFICLILYSVLYFMKLSFSCVLLLSSSVIIEVCWIYFAYALMSSNTVWKTVVIEL